MVYAAYADNDFYVVPVHDLSSLKVYKVTLFTDEAEWLTLDAIDHISAMEISGDLIVVCNGKTQELMFFNLDTHQHMKTIPRHRGVTISQLTFSPRDSSLYYCTEREVGTLKLENPRNRKLVFPHPCKVTKVLNNDGRMVVTIGEDNILRIWDQIMEPFSPDLSIFTGKVTVHSEGYKDSIKSLMDGLFSDLGSNLDFQTKDLLTTADAKNYWTSPKGGSTAGVSQGDVMTKFHLFADNQHIAVTQSFHNENVSLKWTKCFSIWDLSNMQCVRRLFLPELVEGSLGTVFVHCVVDGYKAVIQVNGLDVEYKLLDLKTWKTETFVASTSVKKLWDSRVLHLTYRQSEFCIP